MITVERCDLCEAMSLEHAYDVPGTARGLSVYVCAECGLVQSLPRIDHVPRNSPFPDSGAGFGNIRYGKGFRTEFALQKIEEHIDLNECNTCLDVGANRGSFLLALLDRAPHIKATAIEPDERVLEEYSNHSQINLINKRVEQVDLGHDQFDIVYHCHTLEHQAHPLASLKAIRHSLTDKGLMFLEVPNIEFLNGTDVVEEWFIDKHLYHYSAETLCATVMKAGFEIMCLPDSSDKTNVTIIAKKTGKSSFELDGSQYLYAKNTVSGYIETLKSNQEKLVTGASRLSEFCNQKKVSIWGAGRIYTSIVDIGGFDPQVLAAVVDKTLYQYVGEMFGVKVQKPDVLKLIKPEVVLVASRLYFEEIREELSILLPETDVLTLDDILAGNIGVENV